MVDKTIPDLDAVSTPVVTDISNVRQVADTEDRKITRAQQRQLLVGEQLDGTDAASAAVRNVAASATVPTLVPNKADPNSGVGSRSGDEVNLIAGGVEGLRLVELDSGVVQVPNATLGITAFSTGGQGSAVPLIASFNVITTVAAGGDSVALPAIFAVNTLVYIKNDDAANACAVFPASGDDLGEGADTALSLPAGESVTFIATAADTTWTRLIPIAGVPQSLVASDASGPTILDEDSTPTNPTLVPDRADPTTGIGGDPNEVAVIIEAVSQLVVGPDGKFFVNTLTGVGFQGGNIVSLTPADVVIYAAGSVTSFVNAGNVDIWGGYGEGNDISAGSVRIWGGGGGSGPATPGNVMLMGGDADARGGHVELHGGKADVAGVGGNVTIEGGDGVGVGADDGGNITLTAGRAASGGSGDGGEVVLTGGIAASASGNGGDVRLIGGAGSNGIPGAVSLLGGSTGSAAVGGDIDITGGAAGPASGANSGGAVTIKGGLANTTAQGGKVTLEGGDGEANELAKGGDVELIGGAAGTNGGDGGDVLLTPSVGDGAGADGAVLVTRNMEFNDAAGPSILDLASNNNVPNLIPNKSDLNTGIGNIGGDSLTLVSGGLQARGYVVAGGSVLENAQFQNTMTAFATGGQANATQIRSSISLFTTVASDGDSCKLPLLFNLGVLITIRNSDTASLDIFPALGDDLGAGTDIAVALAGGNTIHFLGNGQNATWVQIDSLVAVALLATDANGPQILDQAPTATDPNIRPRQSDINSGIGSGLSDEISVIAGGVEAQRWVELNGGVITAPHADLSVTAFATGGQGSAFPLIASFNIIDVCATNGDSVRLPTVFAARSQVYVKNDGAATCDVFPASSDDLGLGTNVAFSLAAGEGVTFIATAANTTWTRLIAPSAISTESLSATDAAGPAVVDEAATATNPTLIPNKVELDTGIGWSSPDNISFILGGASIATLSTLAFQMNDAGGPALVNEAASIINPTLVPDRGDADTGIGADAGGDSLAMVVGGTAALVVTESGLINTFAFDAGDNGAEQVGALTSLKSVSVSIPGVAAATLTAASIIPAGAFVVGITGRIETTFGNGSGLTAFNIGDGVTATRWGTSIALTGDTTVSPADADANIAFGHFPAANDIVLTSITGDFEAVGTMDIIVHYFELTPATA